MRRVRFQRLYTLLTGAVHPTLPSQFNASDHLRADIGLPWTSQADRLHGQFGTFPADPCRH